MFLKSNFLMPTCFVRMKFQVDIWNTPFFSNINYLNNQMSPVPNFPLLSMEQNWYDH